MNRRGFLGSVGCALATVSVAGCLGAMDAEVHETVGQNGETYNFEVSEGDTIEIEIENDAGAFTSALLIDPDNEDVLDMNVETEDTFEVEAEMDGPYSIWVTPSSEATVTVWVND